MNDREALHRAICASHQKGLEFRWQTCDLTAEFVQKWGRGSSLAVAQDLAVSQRTVQRWAEEGAAWQAFGLPLKYRETLSPSHVLATYQEWQKTEEAIPVEKFCEHLIEAAEERWPVEFLRNELRNKYNTDGDKPDWVRWLPTLVKWLRKIRDAYGTPRWLLDAIDTILETIEERIENGN